MKGINRIRYLPISFYSIILGLVGFTIAFQKAEQMLGMPFVISPYILISALASFAVITILYLTKTIVFPGDVLREFRHPTKLNFFSAFSISLLLFSVAFLSVNVSVAKYLWIVGVILHFLFTIGVFSFWIQHDKLEIIHMNPAWFIPVVGNILVPVAGVTFFSSEISWFFFSIGLGMWISLFAILINRLIFHRPIHEKLLPTLFILIAPPAVGFISYVKLTDSINDFAKIMFYFALFMLVMLVSQVKYLHTSKFYLSWWAYSFPVSAITIATSLMFHKTDEIFFKGLSYILLFVLCLIVIGLVVNTIKAIRDKQICVRDD